MTRTSSRSGSALLIVLGMLSFMIVSAVGFATYMRYSRQPSSFLRRSSSTRQLAKAALTEAIDTIDRAIGNNPHPGVGNDRVGTSPWNGWQGRVFTGTNVSLNVSNSDTGNVSPLCLEALAYIPAPLVNEARYYSRFTPTTQWQQLGFDSGRYTWLALDVSDYFDVNRMVADYPRSSASNRRVTLAHLFENSAHTSAPQGAKQWDSFMETFRGKMNEDTLSFDLSGKEPLISIADFNLALGNKGKIGELRSPFYDYLTGTSNNGFYNLNGETEKEKIRRLTFVTDSYQAPLEANTRTAEGETIYDLSDGQNQPFAKSFLDTERPALSDCVLGKKMPSDSKMKWVDHLSGLGCAALYDYLDPDHVPISLAIPTTERVPMFCGVQPNFTGASWGVRKTYKFENNGTPKRSGDQDDGQNVPVPEVKERPCKQTVYYKVSSEFTKGFMTGDVRALACFPFNHKDTTDKSFSADGRLSFFLTTGDVSLRTQTADDPYHLTKQQIEDKPLDTGTGIISAKLASQQVSFTGVTIAEQKDAVKALSNPLASAQGQIGTQLAAEGNELLRVDYTWTQTFEEDIAGGVKTGKGSWNPSWDDAVKNGKTKIESAHCGLPATVWQNKAYVKVDPEMANNTVLAEFLQKGGSKEMTLRAAVWLRMLDSANKIVDLVPACVNDDAIQNQINDPMPLMKILANDSLGRANPLMLFNTGVSFTFSIAGLDDLVAQPKPIDITPKQAIVSDPRYNHAPEHWYKIDADLTAENWLQNCQLGSSNTGRDNDIFMATSDSGYLQSRYEVAFLPRFTTLTKGGDTMGRYESPDGGGVYTSIPDSFGATRNQNLVWQTFDPFKDNCNAFYNLPWRNLGSGQAVNPYSDSTNVLMAAFANTPIDWKRASTNLVDGAEDFASMTVTAFNSKYAFNEYAPQGTRLAWVDLEDIAGTFMEEMHRSNGRNWEDVWDDLGWAMEGQNPEKILGFTLDSKSDKLWTTDRKFLYGFWRDCFAARQQLFLVFFRTEPMMMGSDGNGQVPPQLGARGMAVVWRNPAKTKNRNDGTPQPHQTRVLFYRQFE